MKLPFPGFKPGQPTGWWSSESGNGHSTSGLLDPEMWKLQSFCMVKCASCLPGESITRFTNWLLKKKSCHILNVNTYTTTNQKGFSHIKSLIQPFNISKILYVTNWHLLISVKFWRGEQRKVCCFFLVTRNKLCKSSPRAPAGQSEPSCLDLDPCVLCGWSSLDRKWFETSSPEHDCSKQTVCKQDHSSARRLTSYMYHPPLFPGESN